ncbi:MAG: hypothetical protein ACE5I1_10825 [bacterium]
MIDTLFEQSKPVFISIQDEYFIINDKKLPVIEGFIQDLQPLRKFFFSGKLTCYSYNNKTGKDGQYCAFCRKRFRCQKRLRLMILVTNAAKDPIPATLEINHVSFDNFDELIKKIDPNDLPENLLHISIAYDQKDRKIIEFVL